MARSVTKERGISFSFDFGTCGRNFSDNFPTTRNLGGGGQLPNPAPLATSPLLL